MMARVAQERDEAEDEIIEEADEIEEEIIEEAGEDDGGD